MLLQEERSRDKRPRLPATRPRHDFNVASSRSYRGGLFGVEWLLELAGSPILHEAHLEFAVLVNADQFCIRVGGENSVNG
jgi:hypothetical protein